MKFRAAQLLLLAVIIFGTIFISGCSEIEPDNASVRPWNTPQNWENGQLDGMDYQRR
jgi:hypothetical protein